MSATFVNDVYRPSRPGRSDGHYLKVGRWGVVVAALLLGAFAAFCVFWQEKNGQTFIELALGVMTYAYSGLLGVFLCALFTRRGTSASAVAALVIGFLVTLAMEPALVKWVDGDADALPQWLEWVETLAMPWRMTAATAAAFLVAVSRPSRRR
jgi:Na+/proline symporter